MKDTEVCLKISTTHTCSILDKMLMSLGEVDLDLVRALIPTIIKGIMVDHLGVIVMMITELDTGLTTANYVHIIMV